MINVSVLSTNHLDSVHSNTFYFNKEFVNIKIYLLTIDSNRKKPFF